MPVSFVQCFRVNKIDSSNAHIFGAVKAGAVSHIQQCVVLVIIQPPYSQRLHNMLIVLCYQRSRRCTQGNSETAASAVDIAYTATVKQPPAQ